MGDFDKNPTVNGDAEKKKLMLVGILGAVLLAIVVIHFSKGSPGEAAAATPGGQDAVSAMPDETPEQAAAALLDDPTAKLLRGTPNLGAALEKIPHNPFIMNAEWRATLVKASPTHRDPIVTVTQAAPSQPIETNNLKLTGILRQGNTFFAIINGRMMTAGATFDGLKIVDMTDTEVTLQRADEPDGPKATLTIQLKMQ